MIKLILNMSLGDDSIDTCCGWWDYYQNIIGDDTVEEQVLDKVTCYQKNHALWLSFFNW